MFGISSKDNSLQQFSFANIAQLNDKMHEE